jgi:hypothetical protein
VVFGLEAGYQVGFLIYQRYLQDLGVSTASGGPSAFDQSSTLLSSGAELVSSAYDTVASVVKPIWDIPENFRN